MQLISTYSQLSPSLFEVQKPRHFKDPQLVLWNESLAQSLGIQRERFSDEQWARWLCGNEFPPGAAPLAQAYAGHQFGHYSPLLGDGRALLLGEYLDPNDNCWDFHLKGSGPTKYSRGGDGLAPLAPMLREYLIGEALHGLGIPTSRALAVVLTGEPVYRQPDPTSSTLTGGSVHPGAVLCRIASSHLRVGTFQFAASLSESSVLNDLFQYAANPRGKPQASHPCVFEFFKSFCASQMRLILHWMQVGFIHGVMNTDNTSISGESLDFGPCAFMDTFRWNQSFSFIDKQGRYAFGNQPSILLWNLTRLAESLVPLLARQRQGSKEMAATSFEEHLEYCQEWMQTAFWAGLEEKLGLSQNHGLVRRLLSHMEAAKMDFTLTFSKLWSETESTWIGLWPESSRDQAISWYKDWRKALGKGSDGGTSPLPTAATRAINPLIIPRNHLVQQTLERVYKSGDFAAFQKTVDLVSHPFTLHFPESSAWTRPPKPNEGIRNTFCGT